MSRFCTSRCWCRLAVGDGFGSTLAWQIGGVGTELAIVLFLAVSAVAVARARHPRTSTSTDAAGMTTHGGAAPQKSSLPGGKRPSDRVIGLALGFAMTLLALSVAVVARDNGSHAGVPTDAGGPRPSRYSWATCALPRASISVPMGTRLFLHVTNADTVRHDLYIDGGPRTPLLAHDQQARLDLGTVTHTGDGWCTLPGHKAAGMTMTIRRRRLRDPAVRRPWPHAGMTAPGAAAPTIDLNASPAPDWTPYDPALAPAPGATVHRHTLTIRDTQHRSRARCADRRCWTYNGTAPGPILHGHVGDLFIIKIVNDGDMAHGIDFHAGSVDPDGPMRSIEPGQSLSYQFPAELLRRLAVSLQHHADVAAYRERHVRRRDHRPARP